MQISESTLRRIIREELEQSAIQRVLPAIKTTMKAAEVYVSSIEAGSRDGEASDELADAVEQLKVIVKLFRRGNDADALDIRRFAKLASDLTELSGFWQTPSFLGKDEHTTKLQDIVSRMRNSIRNILAKPERPRVSRTG